MIEVTTTKDPGISALLTKLNERRAKAPTVSLSVKGKNATVTIGANNDADDSLRLMAALGTFDSDFLNAFISQIGNSISSKGELTESALRFALGVVVSINPNDEIEAMLAAQMAAVHVCALDSSRRYLWSENYAGKDSAERAMTKLTRTFAMQMETLKRYRSKGQQVVRVERVTVHEGGQAIVGAVQHGGRGGCDEK